MKRRSKDPISAVDLREGYHEKGEYSAKFLLNPRLAAQPVSVSMRDPDGRQIAIDVYRWGTKVHVSFCIDAGVPDGIAIISIEAGPHSKNFRTWIFK